MITQEELSFSNETLGKLIQIVIIKGVHLRLEVKCFSIAFIKDKDVVTISPLPDLFLLLEKR